MKPSPSNSKYHIPFLPPLLLTGSACSHINSDSNFWEGVAMVRTMCTSGESNDMDAYDYGYLSYCTSYEDVIIELPLRYRYNYFGIYRYTEFANYVLEFTPNYAIFSYIYHYSYAVLFYNDDYEYTSGFTNMFPYTKEQNTYRISIPFSDEDMICRQNDSILSCTSMGGLNLAIAYQKSRKSNLEQYLLSL